MAAARKMERFATRLCESFTLLSCIVIMLSSIPDSAEGALSLSKKCGDISCSPTEYCSQFDKRCKSCESVCEEDSHNFQEDVCQRDCQDYLHDKRYARIDGEKIDSDVGKLNDAVHQLTQLATASLAVSTILLVACAAFVCFMWCRGRGTSGARDAEAGQGGRDLASYLHGKITTSKKSDKVGGTVTANPNANCLKLDLSAAAQASQVQQPQGNSRQTPQPQAPTPTEKAAPSSTPTTAGGRSDRTDAYSPTTTTTPLSTRPPRYPTEDTTLDYAYDNRALTPSPRFDKEAKGNGTPNQHPPTPYNHPQHMGIKGETTF
ncbi:protein grindelwald [Ischnura elegans]|uniref:protein grindelwald n=1 Tax=Ischnura elegans TaxID=197161 RepID=UPI001ED88672|nr:protein grindelwald [Ischnura elegans]